MNVIWYEKAVCKIWIVATKCWIKEVDLWIWQGFLQNVRSVIFLTPLMKKKKILKHTHTHCDHNPMWMNSRSPGLNHCVDSKSLICMKKAFPSPSDGFPMTQNPVVCLPNRPSSFFFRWFPMKFIDVTRYFPMEWTTTSRWWTPFLNPFFCQHNSSFCEINFQFICWDLAIFFLHMLHQDAILLRILWRLQELLKLMSMMKDRVIDGKKNHTGVQITTTEYFVDPLNPSIKHSCSLSLSLFTTLPLSSSFSHCEHHWNFCSFICCWNLPLQLKWFTCDFFLLQSSPSAFFFWVLWKWFSFDEFSFFFLTLFFNLHHLNFSSFFQESLFNLNVHFSVNIDTQKKHNWRTHTQQERFLKINNKWNKTDHSKRTTISRTWQQNHQVCTLFVVWISSLQCVAVCLFVCFASHTQKRIDIPSLNLFNNYHHLQIVWLCETTWNLFLIFVVVVVVVVHLSMHCISCCFCCCCYKFEHTNKKKIQTTLGYNRNTRIQREWHRIRFLFFVCVWKQSTKKNDLRRKFWFNVKLMDINWEQTIEGTFFLETVEQLKNNPLTSPKKKSRNQKCWWVQWWELKYVTELGVVVVVVLKLLLLSFFFCKEFKRIQVIQIGLNSMSNIYMYICIELPCQNSKLKDKKKRWKETTTKMKKKRV